MSVEDVFQIGVKVILINPEGSVLLVRSISVAGGEPFWDIPGGRILRREGAVEALTRELSEETGLLLGDRALEFVGCALTNLRIPVAEDDVGLLFLIYKCRWNDTPELHLGAEQTDFVWVSPQVAAQRLATTIPAHLVLAASSSCSVRASALGRGRALRGTKRC